MSEILIIPTERHGVILRELATNADYEAYLEAIDEDREHLSQLGNVIAENYKTITDIKNARTESVAKGKVWTGIWDKDEFKGEISASPKEENDIELGCWLRLSAIGNGYATLAVKALTAYIAPKYKRVFAEVHIKNAASIMVMERAGYSKVGIVERDWGKAIVFEPVK